MSTLFDVSPELIAVGLAVAASFMAMLALLLFVLMRQSREMQHYNFEYRRASLSPDREFYEKELAKITAQLTAAEDRWRDANHLLLSPGSASSSTTSKPDLERFLRGFGISANEIIVDRKLVMVLTPFASDEAETYEGIRAACAAVGLQAVRGDEEFIRGDILSHVVKQIVAARLVIANISTRNPNVFYELGIAHALGKPTLLISRSLEEAPFDIKNNRIIIYNNDQDLRVALIEGLARVLVEIGEVHDKTAPRAAAARALDQPSPGGNSKRDNEFQPISRPVFEIKFLPSTSHEEMRAALSPILVKYVSNWGLETNSRGIGRIEFDTTGMPVPVINQIRDELLALDAVLAVEEAAQF